MTSPCSGRTCAPISRAGYTRSKRRARIGSAEPVSTSPDVTGKGIGDMDAQPLITTSALEYRDALPQAGALIGLDLGTQTIGTAFCDAGWRFASPGKTLKRGKFGADKAALEALIRERSVRGVVIGLPLNMDGSSGPRAQSSRAYARNLAVLGLPILLWDERWSTTGAERGLIAQDMSRAKRAERIDSAAAAVILQAAIDALAGAAF
jgi:putative Holliday junction resolvase